MSDEPGTGPTHGVHIPIFLRKEDKLGDIGAAMQILGRQVGNAVTTQWAQHKADYDVDIVITMKETKE